MAGDACFVPYPLGVFFTQMNQNGRVFQLISWNVRGLGDSDKCDVVRDTLTTVKPTVVCLQETKLSSTSVAKARSFLPTSFRDFLCVDAGGTRGGILTAWDVHALSLKGFIARKHTLTTVLVSTVTDISFTVTNVYAPSDHHDSASFLEDLAELVPHINGPWVLAGDFNLIRSSDDKNNDRVDSRLTELFNDTINSLALLELPLLDRLFTWSNRRESPTLARLDRVFLNTEMSTSFPNSTLTSLTRSTSDHIPLVVNLSTSIPKTNTFRFENSWLFHQDFLPCIAPAWNTAPHVQDAAGTSRARLRHQDTQQRYGTGVSARRH